MRKLWIWIALIAIFAALWIPGTNLLMAGRLLLSIKKVADGASGNDLRVIEGKSRQKHGAQELEALTYRPADSPPKSGIILVPGISELGCYHPRLQALSRFVASQGFLVVTPDIRDFRRFEISPSSMDQIAFWFEQAHMMEGGQRLRRLGVGGISFSGTLALITAARPAIRENVAFVLAIGPYQNPLRCARQWFAADPSAEKVDAYPTRFYAKWIIMLAALNLLPSQPERDFLHGVLVKLLLQQQVPPEPAGLSPEAQRWYRLAVMPADRADPDLAGAIEQYLLPTLYTQISPDDATTAVRCPVFLVHGAFDDLIPPEESRQLRSMIAWAPSYLVISPFITHTHPLDKPLSTAQRANAVLDLLGFFYNFARCAR